MPGTALATVVLSTEMLGCNSCANLSWRCNVSEIGESSELIDELVMESAKEDKGAHKSPSWHRQVALSSLVLALFTALGGLLAGMTAHEALIERTKEIMEVSRLEGDRVSVEVLRAKHDILASLGQPVDPAEVAQIQDYEEEERRFEREAGLEEAVTQETGYTHLVLAIAVTILSVGITLCGMAVVVEEKRLWIAGMIIGAVGALGLAFGILTMLS
jgi:hypothetical protein